MNASLWAIRNPVAPILAFVILLFLGLASFMQLPISRFPSIDTPVISVSLLDVGATPEDLDAQVAPVIEDAIRGLSGVKSVRTTLRDGLAVTTAEFRINVQTQTALQDVQRAVEGVQSRLPTSAEAPVVSTVEAMGGALLTYAISSSDMTLGALSAFTQDEIMSRLLALSGVARVERYGGADPEVSVELLPEKLAAYGLGVSQVAAALRQSNLDLSAGRAGQTEAMRVLGDVRSLEALKALPLPLGGRVLPLSEIAEVRLSTEDLRSFSRVNGQGAIGIAVFKGKGASEEEVEARVSATLQDLAQTEPGLRILPLENMVDFTRGNFETSMDTLIEGAFLAVVVVFLFLRDWRSTLIAALALPLSAIPTFWVMDLLGFSLNLISLLGITLATGVLVDDAIVEIENIARHMRMGKKPLQAAKDAADEIGLAVIATSFTIVAIFVPVSFLPGIPGQYFEQFGLTVAVSVLFSLLVARLITPLLCARFLKAPSQHSQKPDGALMRGYLRLVRFSSKWRYGTLLVALGGLALSIWSIIGIPGAFMPPEDQNRLSFSLELPPGTALEDTESVIRRLEPEILSIEGVRALSVVGGSSASGATDPRRAALTVLLEEVDKSLPRRAADALGLPFESAKRLRPDTEIEAEIFALAQRLPDLRLTSTADLTYSILSKSPEDLAQAVATLESALRSEPIFATVSTDGGLARPQVMVQPKAQEAAAFGISNQSLADTLRLATLGDVDVLLPKIALEGSDLTPIRLRLSEEARRDPARLLISTASGDLIPLEMVADFIRSAGPDAISRLNGARLATIGANLPPNVALGTARQKFKEITAAAALPESVSLAPSGDAELQEEVMSSFSTALTLGLMLMMAVLILLFGSVLQPLTILLTLPFSLGGVAAALHVSGSPLSMPILIGILMLFGIVTKNAILLVDFAILMRKAGLPRLEAVIEAGHKRAQPILMTSIAMAAGMVPSALGVGDGGAFRAPMALAVIGGIIASTLLSLVLVPALYLVMDDLGRLFSRKRA